MPKKNAVTLALALFAAAAVFGLTFAGARMGAVSKETTANAIETETAEPMEADLGIAIPGYDEIRLKANETEQTVYFYNPAQNRCFFVISLKIDEMEIYRSEMIPPMQRSRAFPCQSRYTVALIAVRLYAIPAMTCTRSRS